MTSLHTSLVTIVLVTLKVATVVGSVIGVALFTMNPNVEIALIVSSPGILTVILQFLARTDARKAELARQQAELARANDHAVTMGVMDRVAVQTDGINTKLFAANAKLEGDKATQATQLSETAQKLSHADGVQQERVEERDRQNDAK